MVANAIAEAETGTIQHRAQPPERDGAQALDGARPAAASDTSGTRLAAASGAPSKSPFSTLRRHLDTVLDQRPYEGEIRVAKAVALTVVDIGVATTVAVSVAATVMPLVVAKALVQAFTEVMTEESASQQKAAEFCRIYRPHP